MSSVQSVYNMFRYARNFNQPLGAWDLSGLAPLDSNIVFGVMFQYAEAYNQDLSGWCVSGYAYPGGFATGAVSWVLPQPNWGAPC